MTTDPSSLSSVADLLTASTSEHILPESGFAYVPMDTQPETSTLSKEDEEQLDVLCRRLCEDPDVDAIWTLQGRYDE